MKFIHIPEKASRNSLSRSVEFEKNYKSIKSGYVQKNYA